MPISTEASRPASPWVWKPPQSVTRMGSPAHPLPLWTSKTFGEWDPEAPPRCPSPTPPVFPAAAAAAPPMSATGEEGPVPADALPRWGDPSTAAAGDEEGVGGGSDDPLSAALGPSASSSRFPCRPDLNAVLSLWCLPAPPPDLGKAWRH